MAKLKKQKPKAKAQKPAPKKAAAPKAKKASSKPAKAAVVKKPAHKPAAKQPAAKSPVKNHKPVAVQKTVKKAVPVKLAPFLIKQKDRLLQLRDGMLDSMNGVARDSLRSRAEGSEASAFGMHQADAGSDAYDRDFALSLLSQEQDALYEIDEALKRIELGSYGVCEMSGKPIPHARLEAIPFARYTVDCQSQLEKQNKLMRVRQPVTSLFGLTDEEGGGEGDEEESTVESKE
jgi:RNA polymerase-binding transcription factor DksA